MLALELGITAEQLRSVAERLDDNWDLVRVRDEPCPRAATARPGPGRWPPAVTCWPAAVTSGPGDNLAGYVQDWLPGWLEQVESAIADGCRRARPLGSRAAQRTTQAGHVGRQRVEQRPSTARRRERATRLKGLRQRSFEGSALGPVIDALRRADPRLPGRRAGPLHPPAGRVPPPLGTADLPRPAGPLPPRSCATPSTAAHPPGAGAALPGAPAGRVPGHRSAAARHRPGHRRAPRGGRRRGTAPGPALLRRRSQAVAVPLPEGRHRPVPPHARPRGRASRSRSPATSARPRRSSTGSTTCSTSSSSTATADDGSRAQPDFEALSPRPTPDLAGTAGDRARRGRPSDGDPGRRPAAGRGGRRGRADRPHRAGGLGGPTARRSDRPSRPGGVRHRRPHPGPDGARPARGGATGEPASRTASTPAPSCTPPTRCGRCSWPSG